MISKVIITVISSDKPGVVEAVANCIKRCEGSWLESRLAQMAGKFAGVISASLPTDKISDLTHQLNLLKTQAIHAVLDDSLYDDITETIGATVSFSISGPDRKGIVQDVSKAFTEKHINVQTLSTELSSMPYSGDPLFIAKGTITVPQTVSQAALNDALNTIADQLGLDFSLNLEE